LKLLNINSTIVLNFVKTYKNFYILLLIGFTFNSLSVYSNTISKYGYSEFIKELIFISISLFLSVLFTITILKYFKKVKDVDKTLNLLISINIFIFIFGIILSILMVFLPGSLVPLINGAKRWIVTPFFSISPIEIIKYGFLFVMAILFSSNKFIFYLDKKHSFELYIPFYLFFLFLTVFVVLFQKDFGNFFLLSTIFILVVLIYFKNTSSFWWFIFSGGILFTLFIISEEHRINRVLSWFYSIYQTQNENVDYNNYQILQGLYTINEGLLKNIFLGCGYLESVMKFKVPELHTDMVFTSWISENGILGLFVYFLFIFFLSYNIYTISSRINNYFLYVYSFVLISYFWITIFINLFGVLGLIPFKGISVPFLSYGGSNLITNTLLIINFTLVSYLLTIKDIKENINLSKK